MSNPFKILYDGIWDMVEDFAPFTAAVKLGNRIKLDSRVPQKPSVSTADVPEVILVPSGGVIELNANSSQSRIERNFTFMISTGDLRTDLHFDLQFYIIQVGLNWKTRLSPLTWEDRRFVENVRLTNVEEGMSDPERNRNINGWSSLMTVETHLVFETDLLKGTLDA